MIDDLNYRRHDKGGQPLDRARALIRQWSGGPLMQGLLLDDQSLTMLGHDVYRVSCEASGIIRTWVIKRFANQRSKLERLAITQWLPNAALAHICPTLLGVAPDPSGEHVWHLYEDLGDYALDPEQTQEGRPLGDRGFLTPLPEGPDRNRVDLLIHLMADVHERFMDNPLLDEYRSRSTDLGERFYRENVRDAIEELEALKDSQFAASKERTDTVNAVLSRMHQLRDEASWRTERLKDFGGRPTLLHGDFGVKNAFVVHTDSGLQAKLIDWDHTGVGPVSYDLSTFLVQLPLNDRIRTLDSYTRRRNRCTDEALPYETWNQLFETHEFARLANCVAWACKAVNEGQIEWTFEKLAKIDAWLEAWRPVLPVDEGIERREKILHH
ncbi:MAG TPA: phosphotransferase [Pontiella sp.]|nr:phosphotransferase [Pontiella sp.]